MIVEEELTWTHYRLLMRIEKPDARAWYCISTETKDFFIDLVFYNFILKCFLLIDLKPMG